MSQNPRSDSGTSALKELLFKMADDQLILGHRNSEWTGMGPLLEEDIAFSSMAQDKVGQSQALYTLLNGLGEGDPDQLAFMRQASMFRNCILVELPNGEYDFSIIRHFLFDTAESLRFELLASSSYQPLAQVAVKIRGELRYHTLHANTWVAKLGNATEESITRMQSALDYALPFSLGIFEPSPHEVALIENGIFQGEARLREAWRDRVAIVIGKTKLRLPSWDSIQPVEGGRAGKHSEYLQPLLDEMSEVFRIDPKAEW
jgi:ring-1,2-phenylacetyl-CoA epoxidase subunit PaaC